MMCGVWGIEEQVSVEPGGGDPTPRAGEACPGILRMTRRVPGDAWLWAVMEESVGQLPFPGLGKCLGSEGSWEGRDMKWPQ